MNRRRFLELAILSSPFLAGCSGQSATPTEAETNTPQTLTESPGSPHTSVRTQTPTNTPTVTAAPAALEFSDLSYPGTISQGEPLNLSVQVENVGGKEISTPIILQIGNFTVMKQLRLKSDTSKTLVFGIDNSTGYPEPGSYQLTVRAPEIGDGHPGFQVDVARPNPDTLFVGPEGSDTNPGTKASPFESIQAAINEAQPGQTVYAKAGRYEESLVTKRSGKPNQPITITGPPDAVVTSDSESDTRDGCMVRHSHIHITGLTFDGLKRPSKPDDPHSYMLRGITCIPKNPQYSKNIVIKPHTIGNAQGSLVDLNFVEDIEVGEFEVIGPAGLRWLLTDSEDHWGEIVYIGQAPPTSLGKIDFNDELSESGLDLSNNIHIHHIDNSAGHDHSEIANTKLGTHDVLIEYCTDAGGSQNTETYPSASVRLQSYDATVRWCDLRNGKGDGVEIGSFKARDRQQEKPESELIEAEKRAGTDNAIYGNKVLGFDDEAFNFPLSDKGQTPDAQSHFCGNEYDGQTHGNPSKSCPDDVPEVATIGHLGGDSPWAGEES